MTLRTGIALAAVGLACAFVTWALADSSTGGSRPAAGRLLFSDEFDGARLDRRKWRTCHWWARRGCTIATNHELEWYLSAQTRVRRGSLRLVARRRPVRRLGRTFPYRSGMISSGAGRHGKPRFAFRYGRAEMRARVPVGKGLWSAFWMLPVTRESEPEIDVMEILGHQPRTVELHVHQPDTSRGREHRLAVSPRRWHTYAIDWRPGRLVWLVDRQPVYTVTGALVPDEEMYLVANLAVGGDWPGKPARSTRFPSALEIDYVRVWE